MSLLDAAERFASLDRSQVQFDANRCLRAQDQYSDCEACFDICPAQAISAGKPPSFHETNCQSCLACLPVCPVGAYRADDSVASLLNCVTHIEDQPVELLCHLHPRPAVGMEAGAIGIQLTACLAALGTGACLTLFALGLEHITLRTDACRACKWHSLHPQIHQQAERANRFYAMWNQAGSVTCADEVPAPVERILWNAKNPPLSRRDLFRMLARQGQTAMARALENGVSTGGRQPGRDRLRLLAAVAHLPGLQNTPDLAGFGFAALNISEACTACGACAKACPTNALSFEKNDTEMTFSISFSAPKCIGCDLCAHACQPEALVLDHAPAFEQVFGQKTPSTVAAGAMVKCKRCQTLMAAREGVSLCALCEYRRAHPFGSVLPKKLEKETGA